MKKLSLSIIPILFFVLSSTLILPNNKVFAEQDSPTKIRVIYFYAEGCPNCQKIEPFIEKVKSEYSNKIEFLQHNVREKEKCRQLFFNFLKAYNVPENKAKVPIVFVGKDYLVGVNDIKNNLIKKIDQKIKDKENLLFDCHKFLADWPNVKKIDFTPQADSVCDADANVDYCNLKIEDSKETKSNNTYKKLSLGVVIFAAIVDSINPCAIAVLIFLLTVLVSFKASRMRMIKIGFIYISAVFITYYLAGLGLIGAISGFNISSQVSIIAGVLVLFAGFVEIKEGLNPNGKQLLVIPKKAKPIFTRFLKKATIPSVFVAGILVSAFELPCTGQVYLGILSILSQESLKMQGYFYLFIYNLIFVFPLVVILLVSAFGFNVNRLEQMRKKNRMIVKILMGITMILLGLFLLVQSQIS